MVELLLLVLLLGCVGVWSVLALGLVHVRCCFLRCAMLPLAANRRASRCSLHVWPALQHSSAHRGVAGGPSHGKHMCTFVQACAANIMHYALFVNSP